MQWLEKARAMLHAATGLALPDPDRIDIGSVPDTTRLIEAIDAAMPRTAILQLIGPRDTSLRRFLTRRSIARRRSTGEFYLSLDDGSTAELARRAALCAPDEVCSHLFVQDGEHTLIEAFGRDKGEEVVWVNRRVPRGQLRLFLEIVSRPSAADAPRRARHVVSPQALTFVAALTLLACVQRPALVVETSTGEVVRLESWTASLSSSAALHGTATLSPGATYRETLATIALSGAAPGVVHAWYVQLGQCGRDLGILQGPQAYTPLVADEKGEARSTVTLPFTVPMNGNYFVTVRQADTDRSAAVACGNLAKNGPDGPAMAEARSP